MRKLCLITAFSLLSQNAWAYVLPTGFILGKVAEKRAGLGVNEVEIAMATHYPGVDESLDEKLLLKRPGKMRWSRPQGDAESAIIVKDGERAVVGVDGSVTRTKVSTEPLLELLLPKGQAQDTIKSEYQALLQKLGVDTSKVTLARFSSRVAYVIGGSAQDKDKPQLWIDKDAFWPVRVIYLDTVNGRTAFWDVQFREFGSRETGEVFPRVIERYFDGKLVSHSEIDSLNTQAKLPEQFFNMPGVKAK